MTTTKDSLPEPEHRHGGEAHNDHAMAQLLDLDAEVLRDYLDELTGWLAELADPSPRRILDLGSGTGTGSFALLRRFESATIIALDVSPHMVQRLEHRARELGLGSRVTAVQADLNKPWPRVEAADLAWAASSLHHLDDPGHALRQAFAAIRPGGLLVATEMDNFPRVLPEDIGIGRPGLGTRIHAALGGGPGVDWTEALVAAGFVIDAARPFVINLPAPAPEATGRYANAFLGQLRRHLDDQLDAQDISALDTLLATDGPHSLLGRTDLHVETTRTTWVARRP
ncbi:MAG: methyltransferase type 12 [Marmoricola sp.]|nr:methyltransferase type 12 [Marmoricola sp.]